MKLTARREAKKSRKSVNLFAVVVVGVDVVGAAATAASTLASSLLEFMLIFKRTHALTYTYTRSTPRRMHKIV